MYFDKSAIVEIWNDCLLVKIILMKITIGPEIYFSLSN